VKRAHYSPSACLENMSTALSLGQSIQPALDDAIGWQVSNNRRPWQPGQAFPLPVDLSVLEMPERQLFRGLHVAVEKRLKTVCSYHVRTGKCAKK